jgi:8-oxo-dGTP pyrophosphatase MutT (NUDIX family)
MEERSKTMQKPTVQATVVLLVDKGGRICLARKKQPIHHDYDKGGEDIPYSLGTYNGYGGKREPTDASIFQTAIRELAGESGVKAREEDLDLVSRVFFWKPSKETGIMMPFMEVSFFFIHIWEGEPLEGDEMGPPAWFTQDEVPYRNMMPADKGLFQRIFAGERAVFEVRLPGKDVPPEIIALDEPLLVAETN